MPAVPKKCCQRQLKRDHIHRCIDDLQSEMEQIPREKLSAEARQERLNKIQQEILQLHRELQQVEEESKGTDNAEDSPDRHVSQLSWESDARAIQYLRDVDKAMEASKTAEDMFLIMKLLVKGPRAQAQIEERVAMAFRGDPNLSKAFLQQLPAFPQSSDGADVDTFFEQLQLLLEDFSETYTYLAEAEWALDGKPENYTRYLNVLSKHHRKKK